MCLTCNDCSKIPPVVKELTHVIRDGNPLLLIQIIGKLATMGLNAGYLSEDELKELGEFHFLLSEIAIQRDHDKDDTIHQLKIPA